MKVETACPVCGRVVHRMDDGRIPGHLERRKSTGLYGRAIRNRCAASGTRDGDW